MPKTIKMGPSAPPLHEQLGVEPHIVRNEQNLLMIITKANEMGTSAEFTKREHRKILQMLSDKGLIKLKS